MPEFIIGHTKWHVWGGGIVMSSERNDELSALLVEYKAQREELHLRLEHRMKGLTFLISAFAILATFGLKEKIHEVFVFIPWFFIGIIAYFGHQSICARLTMSYLEEIEERIGYIDYEKRVVSMAFRNAPFSSPYKLLFIFATIPFFMILGYSLWDSFNWISVHWGPWQSIANLVLLLLSGIWEAILIKRGLDLCSSCPSKSITGPPRNEPSP